MSANYCPVCYYQRNKPFSIVVGVDGIRKAICPWCGHGVALDNNAVSMNRGITVGDIYTECFLCGNICQHVLRVYGVSYYAECSECGYYDRLAAIQLTPADGIVYVCKCGSRGPFSLKELTMAKAIHECKLCGIQRIVLKSDSFYSYDEYYYNW